MDCDACNWYSSDSDTKKPDFIVLYQDLSQSNLTFYVIVEMKSRLHHTSDIVEQLQSGIDILDQRLDNLIDYKNSIIIPLVLKSASRSHEADFKNISKNTVTFRGSPRKILVKRCGSDLSPILKQYIDITLLN